MAGDSLVWLEREGLGLYGTGKAQSMQRDGARARGRGGAGARTLLSSARYPRPVLLEGKTFYSISFRDCFARAAPIAVLTSFSSSGGGRTAFMPSDWIHSSRAQPCVW